MTDHVREQLLGYLLGALEEDEEALLDKQLEHDDTLRQQLTEAWHSLKPLRQSQRDFIPPFGLATRTCETVAELAEQPAETPPLRSARADTQPAMELPAPVSLHADAAMTPAAAPAGFSGGWTWADLAVAASVAAAAFLLIFPAIENSRFNSRLAACQDNLRQVGVALAQYSQRNHGSFPEIPASGPLAVAGIYAPTLLEGGYLEGARQVVCPGSVLAQDDEFSVPTMAQLQVALVGEELTALRRRMGGSYGYTLGYVTNGRYRSTKNMNRPHFALMADAPSYTLPELTSLNHAGLGQNVLFEDGRVVFLATPKPDNLVGDFFLNDTGLVAAGMHQDDSVIGASATAPVWAGCE
jgi:hypothetical protein